MHTVDPTLEHIAAFARSTPDDKPIVMVNRESRRGVARESLLGTCALRVAALAGRAFRMLVVSSLRLAPSGAVWSA